MPIPCQLMCMRPGPTYTKPSYFTSNVKIYDHSYAKYTWLSQNLRKHIVKPLLNSYKVPAYKRSYWSEVELFNVEVEHLVNKQTLVATQRTCRICHKTSSVKMEGKRVKKNNFSTEEVVILIDNVENYRDVLFSKLNNTMTNTIKKRHWKDVTDK